MGKLSDVMKKLAAIAVILWCAGPLHAQFKVKKSRVIQDYVVTLEEDTLWGEVRYGNHVLGSRLNKIILFDENGGKNKFKAHELKSFRNDRREYDSIKIDGYKYFARKVVSGEVNMYYCEYTYASNYHTSYTSENDQIGVSGKTITVYLERNGNVQRVFKKKISEDLFPFMGDNEELMNSVEMGECTFDELDQVVASYNEWLAEK